MSANDPPSGVTIGVFAKHWTPGATKTRLAASIGAENAAAVSRCLLRATLHRVGARFGAVARLGLMFTPSDRLNAFEALAAAQNDPWEVTPQSAGDFGERLQAFFAAAFRQTRIAVLIGSDSPDLPLAALGNAIEWLSTPDGPRLVMGPSEDGGYWLIAARDEPPPVFEAMPWSQSGLLAATRQSLARAGWSEGTDYRLATPWYDVDERAGLARLRRGLRCGDAALVELADGLDRLLGEEAD